MQGKVQSRLKNTKDWLIQIEPEEFDCTIITTYPGSPYFDDAIKSDGCYVYTSDVSNDKLYQAMMDYLVDLDYYKGDPDGGYISYVWTDHISADGLVKARDALEKEVRAKTEDKNLIRLGQRPSMSTQWEWEMSKFRITF